MPSEITISKNIEKLVKQSHHNIQALHQHTLWMLEYKQRSELFYLQQIHSELLMDEMEILALKIAQHPTSK